MIRIRMLQILFPFFLLVACKSVDAGDVINIGQAVGPPIMTEVKKASFTPTPTFGATASIKEYFVFASSPNCEFTFDKFNDTEPFQSIVCRENDITVRYDQWAVKATMDEVHENFLAASEEVTSNTTWNDENQDKPLGNFY